MLSNEQATLSESYRFREPTRRTHPSHVCVVDRFSNSFFGVRLCWRYYIYENIHTSYMVYALQMQLLYKTLSVNMSHGVANYTRNTQHKKRVHYNSCMKARCPSSNKKKKKTERIQTTNKKPKRTKERTRFESDRSSYTHRKRAALVCSSV